MANYNLLKSDIDAKVYQNGRQEITGENLNSVLNAMVTTLGAEYQFAGVATRVTEPGTPDAKVFYIANGKGTYTNFGSLEVTEDEVVVLYYDTEWHKVATGIASQAKLTELDEKILNIDTNIRTLSKSIKTTKGAVVILLDNVGYGNFELIIKAPIGTNYQITAFNRATGNEFLISSFHTTETEEITYINPRPDLDLYNLSIQTSLTSNDWEGSAEIRKTNLFQELLQEVLNEKIRTTSEEQNIKKVMSAVSKNFFNSDNYDFEYVTLANLEKSNSTMIIDYLGKVNCEFFVEGSGSNSFNILATNKKSGNVFNLYSAKEVDLPISFVNPRPDLEFVDVKIVGTSKSVEGELKICIRKSSIIRELKESTERCEVGLSKIDKVTEGFDSANLYDPSNDVIGNLTTSGTIDDTSTNFKVSDFIFVKAGENFVIPTYTNYEDYDSAYGYGIWDINKNWISRIDTTAADIERGYMTNHLSIDGYIRIRLGKNATNIMVNKGTSLLPYTPYVEPTAIDFIARKAISILNENTENIEKRLEYRLEYHFNGDAQSSASVIIPYVIKAGKTYLVKNISPARGHDINLFTRRTESGSNIETIANGFGSDIKNNSKIFTATEDTYFIRCFAAKGDSAFSIEDISSVNYRINELEEKKSKFKEVRFDFNKPMNDVSSVFSEFDFGDKMFQTDVIEQVYAKMDLLASEFPAYITKSDAVDTARIGIPDIGDYPDYANGVMTEGTYKITPRYRIYMYRLCSDNIAHYDEPKKKIIIFGGVHGNEKLAPVNLYILAYNLAHSTDSNFLKLRETFDIYIIPYVNGYGCYHSQRGNANGVNINRNFPTWMWAKAGESSKTSQFECNFTGDYAGSEFETKIIMGCVDAIKPDIAIDHHNYGEEGTQQFYTVSGESSPRSLVHLACLDVCARLINEMPSYFHGKDNKVVINSKIQKGSSPTVTEWIGERGIVSYTIEVGHCINFNEGVLIEDKSSKESFTNNVAKIAEYTLRQQLMIYVENVA